MITMEHPELADDQVRRSLLEAPPGPAETDEQRGWSEEAELEERDLSPAHLGGSWATEARRRIPTLRASNWPRGTSELDHLRQKPRPMGIFLLARSRRERRTLARSSSPFHAGIGALSRHGRGRRTSVPVAVALLQGERQAILDLLGRT